ncbi:hypothetical protein V8G54_037460 [Vigna mungo]|uniref:Uncharacterized protein n=1 Tax=Vigna mungo TaxID=3915 RepID=A0AAQ3RFE4_VIGMU
MKNDRGDTALHVAASRGFTKICEFIVGENRERTYLVELKNKEGETPLFQAALNWKKQAFAYLSNLSGHSAPLQDLVRHNGDSMLVEPVNPIRQMEKILKKLEKKSNDEKCSYPENYTTLCEFIAGFKSLGALTGNGFYTN